MTDLVNLLLSGKNRVRITVTGQNVTYHGRVVILNPPTPSVEMVETPMGANSMMGHTFDDDVFNTTGNYTSLEDGKFKL